jgi:anion-transporting  ArsA/GET3 family ATPase
MRTPLAPASLIVVVGGGGVGKTTVAAALALASAQSGLDTLVMTFDPSMRLKDALGVGDAARDHEVDVRVRTKGRLAASLLDGKATFDRLVRRHAPDPAVATRILSNRFYANLSGSLAGVLEYMAVERLFEVASEGRYDRIILDTPPTRQAIDFLEAPVRMVGFLESGAIRIALRPWFDDQGHLRGTRRLGFFGRSVEHWFDRVVGLGLLRDMAEFFLSFGPLYEGFRQRAQAVNGLLTAPGTAFVLVTRPDQEHLPETLFFARRLVERGHHLGPLVVNMRHPAVEAVRPPRGVPAEAAAVMHWLGERDARGLQAYRDVMPGQVIVDLPLFPDEPTALDVLARLSDTLVDQLDWGRAPEAVATAGKR